MPCLPYPENLVTPGHPLQVPFRVLLLPQRRPQCQTILSPPRVPSPTSQVTRRSANVSSASALSSVRNIVAAWKERTPTLGKTSKGSAASTKVSSVSDVARKNAKLLAQAVVGRGLMSSALVHKFQAKIHVIPNHVPIAAPTVFLVSTFRSWDHMPDVVRRCV